MSELDYTWEDDEGVEHVATVGYNFTAGRPANTRYGHPDNYSPEEPAEIDITEVTINGQVLNRHDEEKFLSLHGPFIEDAILKEHEEYEPDYEYEED